jgi:MoaA/NifB/PqqE/SkfB family radical SAM enzyme
MVQAQKLETMLHKNDFKDIKVKELTDFINNYYKESPFPNKFYFAPTEKYFKIIRKKINTVIIHITNRCNAYCKVCFKNSSWKEKDTDITLEELKYLIKKIGRGKQIILFGGEPTIRKDIFEIIELIKSSGNIVEMYTNGWMLAKNDFLRKLKKAGLSKVYLSFDGFDPKVYREIKTGDFEFMLKMKALKNLMKENMRTTISFVLAKGLNEKEFENVLNMTIKLIRNGYPIEGIMVNALTKYGRVETSVDYSLDSVKAIDILEKVSNNLVNFKYLLECKKLAINVSNIMSKFGFPAKFMSFSLFGLYKVNNAGVEPIMSIEKLEHLNKLAERKRWFEFALEFLKSKELRKYIFKINPRNIVTSLRKLNIFYISVGNIHVPTNFLHKLPDTIDLEKIEGELRMSSQLEHAGSLDAT